jgi:hypothetical protein
MKQRQRRFLVLAQGSCFAFSLGVVLFAGPRDWVLSAMFLAFVPLILMLVLSRSGIPEMNAKGLDERQLEVVRGSLSLAYRVMAVVVTACFAWFILGPSKMPMASRWDALFFLYVILTTALPTAIVAWREPDGLPEEQASPWVSGAESKHAS